MINNSILIEKYFDRALTEEEKVLFRNKCSEDEEFANEVEEYGKLIYVLNQIKVPITEKEAMILAGDSKEKEVYSNIADSILTLQLWEDFLKAEREKIKNSWNEVEKENHSLVLSDKIIREFMLNIPMNIGFVENRLNEYLKKIDKNWKNIDIEFKSKLYSERIYGEDIVLISWYPIDKIADIRLEVVNDKFQNEDLPEFTIKEYDLKKCNIIFKKLRKEHLYYLCIKTKDYKESTYAFFIK